MVASKLQLQNQLNSAWTTNLIDRIEAGDSGASQTSAEHGSRTPEKAAGKVANRIAEIWMVKDIEDISSHSQNDLVRQGKSAVERKVYLRDRKASQRVAS